MNCTNTSSAARRGTSSFDATCSMSDRADQPLSRVGLTRMLGCHAGRGDVSRDELKSPRPEALSLGGLGLRDVETHRAEHAGERLLREVSRRPHKSVTGAVRALLAW
jgi:hypothetical protein